MAKCNNCGATLTCGCQKRTASDGKQVCTNCIGAYEKKNNIVQGHSTTTQTKTWTQEEIDAGVAKLNSITGKFKR